MPTMAGWALNTLKPKSCDFDGDEIMMGLVLSPNSGLDLMQNCDLPPPIKVFAAPDRAMVPSISRVQSGGVRDEDGNDKVDFEACRAGPELGKLELLKALRLSQTRAREAEQKAENLAKEKDCVLNFFLADSTRLFAYRQWVKLLEIQLSNLDRQPNGMKKGLMSEEEDGEGGGGVTWWVALALCLGIAGVGIAFGCRQLF